MLLEAIRPVRSQGRRGGLGGSERSGGSEGSAAWTGRDGSEGSAAWTGRDGPVLAVRVECSSGTYVRVLAADLGAALGGGAHLRRLRRTAVGPWAEATATPLADLSLADVLPPAASLPWLDPIVVDDDRAREVVNGRVLERDGFGGEGDGPWRVIGSSGELLAVYRTHGAAHGEADGGPPPPEPEADTGGGGGVAAPVGPRLEPGSNAGSTLPETAP